MGRWGFTRRKLLRSFLASLFIKAADASTGFDPVAYTLRGFAPTLIFKHRYRIDATILLLGAPVFTRQAAGGGYATVEIDSQDGSRAVALQFAAGSDPARAHGLNRFGILREAIVQRLDSLDISFAGLMTRAREESFEQGRKALSSATQSVPGVLARGRTTGTALQSWIDPLDFAPDCKWAKLDQVLSDALGRTPSNEPRECSAGSLIPFLYAMRSAALCEGSLYRREFTHAGKAYVLETCRRPEHPCELAGVIHNASGVRTAEFRTAYAAGDPSGIPIRIEYRARSFLRLTFEYEPEANQPPIPSVFHQENA
jgi:hypothetical protein